MNSSIFTKLGSLKEHERICHIYTESSARLDLGSNFIIHGLNNKQKCIHISDKFISEEFLFRLSASGIDVRKTIKDGHFREITISKKQHQRDIKDPGSFISFISPTIKEIFHQSNMPLRILENKDVLFFNHNELLRKEALLDQLASQHPIIYMSQFDIRKISCQDLMNLFTTFSIIVYDNVVYDSPFHTKPEVVLNRLNQVSTKYELLTAKEKEILRYIVNGFSNVSVAEEISISVRTVETHRANIMRKLEINNLVDLVKFAILNGIT